MLTKLCEQSTLLNEGRPLRLDGGEAAWRVESGSLSVFGVALSNGGEGRRRYLFTVDRGEVLLGVTDPHRSLVAVAMEPTALTPVEAGDLRSDELETWIGKLTIAADPDRLPEGMSAWERITVLEPLLLRALDGEDRREESEAKARLSMREKLNARLSVDALEALADREGEISVSALSPLLAVIRVVGTETGISFRPPSSDAEGRQDAVESIALASGVRTRRVVLSGQWWLAHHGALVAFLARDKSPVALLPRRISALGQMCAGSRYDILDPVEGSRKPVDEVVAATIERSAISFYRPLEAKRGWWDLAKFAAHSCGRDAWMAGACGIAVALLGLVLPQAMSILLGQAIPDADRGLAWQAILGMAAAVTGSMLFDLTRAVSAWRLQSGMMRALQAGAWDWLLTLSPAFFRRFSIGELRGRVEGPSRIHDQLTPQVQQILSTGLNAIVYVALMMYYSVPLGLLALLAGGLLMSNAWMAGFFISRRQGEIQQLDGGLASIEIQLVQAVSKLSVACAQERAFAYWNRLYIRKQRLLERIHRLRDRSRLVTMTLPVGIVGLSFAFALSGDGLDVATFLAFNMALAVYLKTIADVSDTLVSLVSIRTHWRRTNSVLEGSPEVDGSRVNPGRLRGKIVLDGVSFRYRKDGALTLRNVSIQAEAGECIALVGPSGSGKSTILNLLLGFETPSSGTVRFDGQDLSSLDLVAVRRQMGVVQQDGRLMSQSIFENIVCGTKCNLDDAWEAVRVAGLADDIEQMPMGMHTVVSDGGSNLSGGQRQRLLIARALVSKPRILLLDEATSALDNRTQQIVTNSLNRSRATRIVIAHRLSTIRQADRIYVIEGGSIVQQGTFAELTGQAGLFQSLMQRQTG